MIRKLWSIVSRESLLEEYGWMVDMEENDKKIMEQIKEEEEFYKMVEEDRKKEKMRKMKQQQFSRQNNAASPASNSNAVNCSMQSQYSSYGGGNKQSCNMTGLNRDVGKLNLNSSAQQKATYSQPMRGTSGSLNVNAKEFVPRWKTNK